MMLTLVSQLKNTLIKVLSNFLGCRSRIGCQACIALTFCLAACSQIVYSEIRGERFQAEPLTAGKVGLISYPDHSSPNNIDHILSKNLENQLRERGTTVILLSQQDIVSPPHPGEHPDVIILVRSGKFYSSSSGAEDWAVTIEVLDARMKGVWKGMVHIYQLSELTQASEAITRKIIDSLLSSHAVTLSN